MYKVCVIGSLDKSVSYFHDFHFFLNIWKKLLP